MQFKILVVDDEQDIIELISSNLQREGYTVILAMTGEEALELLKTTTPDLIVLDLMLPGIQGLEVCRQIRALPEHADIPILILSAKGSEVDRILGLEMGADDYMTKPFSVRELISRIRAALRKSAKAHPPKKTAHERTFSHKQLFIDFDKYEVTIKNKKVELSPIQTKLLFFFAKNPGRVYSRDQLLDQVWGGEVFVTPRNVDVHISRLRRLIEEDPQNPAYIVTVTSVGYKFDDSKA
ncbi:MAG TPA: response regulator transcription factor [Syntrophorhabdales bacterium]|nr:response regulator transcription factor [Syntrophorhabdales bacterium]